jgi:hypothetical protein
MSLRPLASGSLIVAAAFFGVLLTFTSVAGLFGLWAMFVLVPALWHYCHAVLLAAAQGRRTIPTVEIDRLNPLGGWRVSAHFIVVWLFLLMLLYVEPFGSEGLGAGLNWAAVLATLFVFPASAAVLGITQSLEDAMNPRGVARLIRILGPAYVALVAPCVALAFVAVLAPIYIFPRLSFPALILSNSIAVWALLATFVAADILIRQNRTEFAIPGEMEGDAERTRRLQQRDWRNTLDLAYASIRSGLVAEGYDALRRLSAEHGDSAEIQYWLFENMLEWEDRTHALQVGARLLERRVAAGDLYGALELFTRCRRLAPGFTVAPDDASALAAFARSLGRHGLADELGATAGQAAPRDIMTS